jgi:hypothetical protein
MHVRFHYFPDSALCCATGYLAGRGLPLTECLAQAFDSNINAHGSPIAEYVRNRLADREDRYGHSLDEVPLHSAPQLFGLKMSEPHRG